MYHINQIIISCSGTTFFLEVVGSDFITITIEEENVLLSKRLTKIIFS